MATYMRNMFFLKRSLFLSKYFTPASNFRIFLSSTGSNTVKDEATKVKHNALPEGPTLQHFIANSENNVLQSFEESDGISPYISAEAVTGSGRRVYIETYGCQMNVNDTEIVWSILQQHKYVKSDDIKTADVILIMTCAIREGAEQKIWNRLKMLASMKRSRGKSNPRLRIGVLGCMAERLKNKLLEVEQSVDLVAGPDSYRNLPTMLAETESGQKSVNVLLSLDETYADVMPVRINKESVTAFVSIMRGCENMCSFCIVPFTRGRERSRPIVSILDEIRKLSDEGVKEVTLLGQNVNSYRDLTEESYSYLGLNPTDSKMEPTHLSGVGFKTIYKTKHGGIRFVDLLEQASRVDGEMRIRFTSPHPKDFPEEVLQIIKERNNICNQIHLPVQSGSSRMLKRMRRGHTREAYLELVERIRNLIPGVFLSSDFICGFCGETDEDFEQTLSLIEEVKYNYAYVFQYSMRKKTHAYHTMKDDVPEEVKNARLVRMHDAFRQEGEKVNKALIGSVQLVLVEGESRRSSLDLAGRSDGGTKVIIPREDIPISMDSQTTSSIKPGDYVAVEIKDANSQVLKGGALYHTTLQQFCSRQQNVACE